MITRNSILGIIVLLAGLSSGYIASLAVSSLKDKVQSALAHPYSREEIPPASMANFSTLYEHSKDQFQEVFDQGQEAIWEAVRRRNVLLQSRERVTMHQEAYEQLILQADREVDMLRLKDYYSQFYMHYFRWLVEGDAESAVTTKLAQGQFKATLDYIRVKYNETPVLTDQEYEALGRYILIAEQSDRVIRWARVLVVILIFLLVMGIPRFIRDSGYKRFSATLYFDALFRPHRISDLNKWHSIKRLAMAIPLLYLFGLVLCSSFVSWLFPLVFGFLGFLPVFILILMTGEIRKVPEMLVSFMAPKILILILVLGIVAVRGPGLVWYLIWESDLYRLLILSLICMLIFRKFYVNVILVRKWSHRNRIGSASAVWMAVGLQFLVTGSLLYAFGPGDSLHAMNLELMLFPGSMPGSPSVHLKWIMIVAGLLSTGALLVFVLNRRKLYGSSGNT